MSYKHLILLVIGMIIIIAIDRLIGLEVPTVAAVALIAGYLVNKID